SDRSVIRREKTHIRTRVAELQEEQLAIHKQATAEAVANAKVTIESLIAEAEAARRDRRSGVVAGRVGPQSGAARPQGEERQARSHPWRRRRCAQGAGAAGEEAGGLHLRAGGGGPVPGGRRQPPLCRATDTCPLMLLICSATACGV